jgi:kynurenine formamidase
MIIDLSVPLSTDTPVYPGDPSLRINRDTTVADNGYLGHTITMGTHNGTHIDAPAHMIEGATTLGQLPLDTFVGPGKLVNGFSLEAIQAADIQAGDIVLFNTSTYKRFTDGTYFTNFPVMPSEVANFLVETGVKLVGLDTGSADNTDDFPIHKKLLGANIPIIETLTNLDALQGKHFDIYALPLKFDLDGAPARVIAEIHNA